MRKSLALAMALACATVGAQQVRETEQRLQQLRGELKSVATERRQLEDQRGDASRKLRQADQQVGGVSSALRETETTLREDAGRLAQLQASRTQLAGSLEARRAELARLLRAARQAGEAPALRGMLAQDRIADAERELIWQGYLQRGRVQRIRELTAQLRQVDTLEREIGERRAALDASREQQRRQLEQLRQARESRAGVLAELEAQYRDSASRERALGRDAKALQQLLARLRAAAAKAEREARARAAREQAAAAKANSASPRATAPRSVASAPALQVGGLGWPVAGSLLASFGGKLPDGRRSDGVLIAAPAGTTVKAVADGRVVFADWMTGYGNILIIDHGNGYMSLYAHNDGLLRSAGDAVRRGEAVANVGASGGQDRPALYFELRRNGQPVNPASWLSRQ